MRSWLVLVCAVASIAAPGRVCAGEAFAGPVSARVVRVVDGDTLKVAAAIWIEQEVTVSVRLAGVDAPELFRPKCDAERRLARAAKDRLRDLAGADVVLYEVRSGKYGGRVVARVETADGVDVAAALVRTRHAVEGARGAWCADG
ncbi:MAG: thermonuclease family protein [Pseudomonadota bacterium]